MILELLEKGRVCWTDLKKKVLGSCRQKNRELLDTLIETGKIDVERKKILIEKDMGITAFRLINSLDENIFKTADDFFSAIFDLWISLAL